jgi:hypothetical protein
MDARALAAALNGQAVSARQVLAPGPGHSPTDRSMSVLIGSEYPDGFWCHSFTDDHWQECRDHVRRAIGLGNCRTVLRRPLSQPQRNGVLGRWRRCARHLDRKVSAKTKAVAPRWLIDHSTRCKFRTSG